MEIKERSAVILCLARDCAPALPAVFRNLNTFSRCAGAATTVFFENDSQDQTKQILKDWIANNERAELIALDGLSSQFPHRTPRLAYIRNLAIETVRKRFADADYVILLDGDDIGAHPIKIEAIAEALNFLERNVTCAGVFPNQLGPYYDLWALRHAELCPNDVWEDVADLATANGVSDEAAFHRVFGKRTFQIAPEQEPIAVQSAFGGLGIYKTASILRNKKTYAGQRIKSLALGDGTAKHSGWQVCEHVSWNRGFIDNNETLFIMPRLINRVGPMPIVSPSWWRTLQIQIGRNDPCPCDSRKKYKHCHGLIEGARA